MFSWLVIFVYVAVYSRFAEAEILGTSDKLLELYDFIVVGGGTAGNVLANRLSADRRTTVLVIEAGGPNDVLDLQIPYLWTSLIGSAYDWNSTSTPQSGLGNRSVSLARGIGLGGSSSINAMLYTLGSADNYDAIAELVDDESWSWNRLEPFFGKDGTQLGSSPSPVMDTIEVAPPRFYQPTDGRIMQTTQENSEFPFNNNTNSGKQLGFGWSKSTIAPDGTRSSSATVYLKPEVINRPNLHVLLNTQVTRLLQLDRTDKTRFDGVEFVENVRSVPSRTKIVAAKREIILSAGAYGTPHILLNSGIGDARDLTSLGITPKHDLPSVGHNLTDHALTTLTWIVNSTTTYESIQRNETLRAMLLDQWYRNGTGDFSSSGIDHVACLRLPSTADIFNSVPDPSAGPNTGHFEIIITNGNIFGGPTPDNLIAATLMVLTPMSRGFVKLNSAHPLDKAAINPSYLSHQFDRYTMRETIRATQRFFDSSAWNGYVLSRAGEFATVDLEDDKELDAYIRDNVVSGLHPVGSSSMSPRGASWGVTDPDLKVKGLQGLRVVDASVIPLIPAAHTQGPTYVYAEMAADIIKKYWNIV
ncbi:hypothetical protein EYR38_004463 [Pleurotus pulmonarius]|nr:hypothetical protein EYR38_004463 [Pleurotus pulmonarius]